MTVVGWISHKGGTGRTVALANAAYHLASLGRDVVCVDLDLASPTMGSVLGLPDIDRGADVGTHSFLDGTIPPTEVEDHLLSVWESPTLSQPSNAGLFALLPGERGRGDFDRAEEYRPGDLGEAIRCLDELYHYVFLDLRSGLSSIAGEFAHDYGTLTGLIDQWLVLHRRTRQHMYGAKELLEILHPVALSPPRRVVTAFLSPEMVQPESRAWVGGRDAALTMMETELLEAVFPEVGPALVRIPDDLLLRLQECIITEASVKEGVANRLTFDAFRELAAQLREIAVTQ